MRQGMPSGVRLTNFYNTVFNFLCTRVTSVVALGHFLAWRRQPTGKEEMIDGKQFIFLVGFYPCNSGPQSCRHEAA